MHTCVWCCRRMKTFLYVFCKNSCLLTTRVSRSKNLGLLERNSFFTICKRRNVSLFNEKGQNTFVRESHVFLRRPWPRGPLHVWVLSNGKIPANRFPWDEENRRGWHGECSNTDLVTTFWKATFLHHHNVADLHKDDVSVDNGPRSSSREKVAMEPCGEVSPRWGLVRKNWWNFRRVVYPKASGNKACQQKMFFFKINVLTRSIHRENGSSQDIVCSCLTLCIIVQQESRQFFTVIVSTV